VNIYVVLSFRKSGAYVRNAGIYFIFVGH